MAEENKVILHIVSTIKFNDEKEIAEWLDFIISFNDSGYNLHTLLSELFTGGKIVLDFKTGAMPQEIVITNHELYKPN